MTEVAPLAPRIRPVLEVFKPNATAFWATTYNVDLELFNEFLLGRLGDPPLNIAILVDPERLASALERIPAEKVSQVAAVNSRWLLRDCRYGSGRFHPKSYLAVTSTRATLLVGSGNLSTSGLDEGREVFTEFVSGTDEGNAAIRVWQSWMRRLVQQIGDTQLAGRFADLEAKLSAAAEPMDVGDAVLLHNLDSPLADQLTASITSQAVGPVDELLVAAPFFDRTGVALGRLIEGLKPRSICVYTTTTTSVDGPHLVRRLEESGADVRVYGYEPDRFTHAKLIGVIAGSRAWVFSGSANLSQAALTLTAAQGNVELSVLAPTTPDEVRTAFLPPDASARALSFTDLATLTYDSDSDGEASALPVHLLHAAVRPDGTIEVSSDPDFQAGWQLDDLQQVSGLVSDREMTVTAGPLAGRLVRIVDANGVVLSNRVVVDDPAALDSVLNVRPRTTADRPPELLGGDLDTPVGKALVWLHRNLVMDVTESASAGGGSGGVGAGETDSPTDDDLWERLEREHLGRDPRVNTYGRIIGRSAGLGVAEPIIELLEAMRDRAPKQDPGAKDDTTSVLRLLLGQADQDEAQAPEDVERAVPRRWASATRVRVRARNVLRRWAAAQADPRLLWIDPMAPAGNFSMIATAFAGLWLAIGKDPTSSELRSEDLDDLWLDWMKPFVGTGRGDGWLDQLDASDAALADRLPPDLPERVAALSWLVLRDKTRDTAIAWQPVLSAALRHGLLEPSEATAHFVSRVARSSVTESKVEEDLLRCIEFIDDDLWCANSCRELALDALRLEAASVGQSVSVRLLLKGIDQPLQDPRVPRLIVAARHYRRCDGLAIFSEDEHWRLVVRTGEPVAYRAGHGDGVMVESVDVARDSIEQMAATGGILADLFLRSEVA